MLLFEALEVWKNASKALGINIGDNWTNFTSRFLLQLNINVAIPLVNAWVDVCLNQ